MVFDKIIVLIAGVLGIFAVYWYFFMKKEETVIASDTVDIQVKGGYNPDSITVPLAKKTILRFTRTDSSSCLEEVVLSDFKVRKYLPMNRTVEITIIPQKTGTFPFTCGMGMFHGKLIVR